MARGLVRRRIDAVKIVGLDEKSFGSGQDYVSIMSDLKEARVLEVVPGNDTQSGCELWKYDNPHVSLNATHAKIDG